MDRAKRPVSARPTYSGGQPVLAWVVLGVVALISLALDFRNLGRGGSIDLRSRVVGARVLLAGQDPYHYKWQLPEPAELCDPFNNLAIPVSTTTVSPAMVAAHLPAAVLPYRNGRVLWLVVQWAALVASALLWMRAATDRRQRLVIACLFAAFTFTAAWRLHAERGQSYVLLLLGVSAWLSMSVEGGVKRGFLPGAIAGCLVALRPPLAVIVLPFLIFHRRAQIAGAVAGLAVAVAVPMVFEPGCWSQYLAAMGDWVQLYLTTTPRPPRQNFPSLIEGFPVDAIARFAPIPFADSSLAFVLRSAGFALSSGAPLLIALAVLYAAWLWRVRRGGALLLCGVAAWCYLADFFLPIHRGTYNEVQVLAALSLAVIALGTRAWVLQCASVAISLGWLVLLVLPRSKWLINLPTIVFAFTGCCLLITCRAKTAERGE